MRPFAANKLNIVSRDARNKCKYLSSATCVKGHRPTPVELINWIVMATAQRHAQLSSRRTHPFYLDPRHGSSSRRIDLCRSWCGCSPHGPLTWSLCTQQAVVTPKC